MERGLLRVQETAKGTLLPTGCSIPITMEGSTIVAGSAAKKKSEEIRELITKLKRVGVSDDSLLVKSVRIETDSGFFTKNSQVTYDLEIKLQDLALVSDVVSTVSDMKSVKMTSLNWAYDNERDSIIELTTAATERVYKKARAMASAMRCSIVGARRVSDSATLPELRGSPTSPVSADDPADDYAFRAQAGRRAPEPSADIGIEYRNERRITVTVSGEFWIEQTQEPGEEVS